MNEEARVLVEEIRRLRDEIAECERRSSSAKMRLDTLRHACRHHWDNPNGCYTPVIREAHHVPADPIGTMGVDWRDAVDVPREETPKWTRTCSECGLVESTMATEPYVTYVPRFKQS